MVSSPRIKQKQCPYWINITRKCKIDRGGLFIPQEDHSEVFCTTSLYPRCLQFKMESENQLAIVEKRNKTLKNRRKHLRVHASYKVVIDRILQPDQAKVDCLATVRTLDLGMGGLRLATDNPLENNSIIHLLFGNTFPDNLQSATGQVLWCNKQIDEPGYQIGISFKNDELVEAMGNFLS